MKLGFDVISYQEKLFFLNTFVQRYVFWSQPISIFSDSTYSSCNLQQQHLLILDYSYMKKIVKIEPVCKKYFFFQMQCSSFLLIPYIYFKKDSELKARQMWFYIKSSLHATFFVSKTEESSYIKHTPLISCFLCRVKSTWLQNRMFLPS